MKKFISILIFSMGIFSSALAEEVVGNTKKSQNRITQTARQIRLQDYLKRQYKQKRVLRRTRIKPSTLRKKKKIEYIPIPRKITNRPDRLGREDSYEKQANDFIVSPELIEKILSKDQLSQGTFVSTFDKNPTHEFYTKTFNEHGVKALIGIGTSDFSWSTRGRKTNINAAIKKFDNIIIPQGAEFSFNDILQSVSKKDGFVYEKVIWNGEDKYQLGGGVCQVSTTVYRAAFNAGLTISKRRNHSFKVGYYYPHGFDATIYLGGQDLHFVNDTPGDIMMQFYTEGNSLIVLLYGTADRKTDTTSHGGWNNSFWWKRSLLKNGENTEEIWRSYYRDRPEEIEEEAVVEADVEVTTE